MSALPQYDQFLFERALEYLRTVDDIRSGLTNVVRSAAAILGSDCASLYLINWQVTALEPYILINIPADYLEGCSSVALGTQCCGRAALHRIPWAVVDMWTDPQFSDCAVAARKSGMRSGISVPIMISQEECAGTIGVQFRHVFEPYLNEVARLSMFARLVSTAILTDMRNHDLSPEEWISMQLSAGPVAA